MTFIQYCINMTYNTKHPNPFGYFYYRAWQLQLNIQIHLKHCWQNLEAQKKISRTLKYFFPPLKCTAHVHIVFANSVAKSFFLPTPALKVHLIYFMLVRQTVKTLIYEHKYSCSETFWDYSEKFIIFIVIIFNISTFTTTGLKEGFLLSCFL